MEQIIKINNKLNRKRIEIYQISGTVNKEGELRQQFYETQKFDNEYDYMVSLTEFDGSSLFPNIFEEKNSKFYYSESGSNEMKSISFVSGSYEVKHLQIPIKDKLGDNKITIELDQATGKSKIKLAPGYKVYFNQKDTFRELVGYDKDIVLDKEFNISPHICNVVDTLKIFINCDIIKGAWRNGQTSQTLYSFSNEVAFGFPLNIKPKHLLEFPLVVKEFNDLTLIFKEEDGKGINFMESPVNVVIKIEQV